MDRPERCSARPRTLALFALFVYGAYRSRHRDVMVLYLTAAVFPFVSPLLGEGDRLDRPALRDGPRPLPGARRRPGRHDVPACRRDPRGRARRVGRSGWSGPTLHRLPPGTSWAERLREASRRSWRRSTGSASSRLHELLARLPSRLRHERADRRCREPLREARRAAKRRRRSVTRPRRHLAAPTRTWCGPAPHGFVFFDDFLPRPNLLETLARHGYDRHSVDGASSSTCRPRRSADGDQVLREARQELDAVLAHDREILDPHAAEAREVDARARS